MFSLKNTVFDLHVILNMHNLNHYNLTLKFMFSN